MILVGMAVFARAVGIIVQFQSSINSIIDSLSRLETKIEKRFEESSTKISKLENESQECTNSTLRTVKSLLIILTITVIIKIAYNIYNFLYTI
ncbi:hypothetical protein B9Z19DRAFT_1121891 [Tuber borchii]|uniref:Uncharacterized protein n=1 Tax=Tuber borchii TaxID=42251 RepID=A0A2T7A1Z8_TUBBO|nr:hypothetical protein B9Z19DRAFT_1121891 [Tuber borchii]